MFLKMIIMFSADFFYIPPFTYLCTPKRQNNKNSE